MNGAQLTAKVTKLITARGGYVVNVIQASRSGIPDLLVCLHGKFLALEIKGKGDRVSALQRVALAKIQEAGGHAIIVRDIDELVDYIENSL